MNKVSDPFPSQIEDLEYTEECLAGEHILALLLTMTE